MIERFFPDLTINSIYDIDESFLHDHKIEGLILDIDNTLVPYHTKKPDEKLINWLDWLSSINIKCCIVSNASMKRVSLFCENLDICSIHNASKPLSKHFLKASAMMGVSPQNIAVVGDQLFTDIYGGNRVNMKTILVKPIDKKEGTFIKFKRLLEKAVIKSYDENCPIKAERKIEWKTKCGSRRCIR